MSTTVDEVQAKLSMDTSMLGKAKRDIAEFSRDGHLGFLHASNGARDFHKALHKLTEEAPLVGLAIRGMLSPIGAALTGATLLFSYVNKQLEEANKEMDEISKENAKAIGLTKEELFKLGLQADANKIKFRSWLEELHRVHDAEAKALERQLAANERLYAQEVKRIEIQKQLSSLVLAYSAMTGRALPSDLQAKAIATQRNYEARMDAAEGNKLRSNYNALTSAGSDMVAKELEARRNAEDASDNEEALKLQLEEKQKLLKSNQDWKSKLPDLTLPQQIVGTFGKAKQVIPGDYSNPVTYALAALFGLEKGKKSLDEVTSPTQDRTVEQQEEFKRHQTALTKAEEAVKALNKALTEAGIKSEETKSKLTEFSDEVKKNKEQTQKAKDALDAYNSTPRIPGTPSMPSSPYTFTNSELSEYNTPYGRVAREIGRRQQMVRNYSAAGNFDIAKQIERSIYGVDVDETHSRGIPLGWKPGQPMDIVKPGYHVPGLIDLLPKNMTEEQQQINQAQIMIKALNDALAQSGKSIPVTIADVSDTLNAK